MFSASTVLLTAAAALWHSANSPEPACRCQRPGEQWLYTQADPVRLAPGAQPAWVSDGSRLFLATAQPFEVERARWLVTGPGERAYWAESTVPSPHLMTRGARLLLPRVEGDGAAISRVKTHRVSYADGRYADALSVGAGSRLTYNLPGDREIVLELIDTGSAKGSRQVSVGWDSGALSTRTVTWPESGTRPGARLQRILLSPPAASRRLRLVALDDVVLRVLAQGWRSTATDSLPAVSYWDPSANDAIARARDNGVDPASRWQVADETRSGRQSFFRSLLPTGSEAAVRLDWQAYRSVADSQRTGMDAGPEADTELDADADAEMDGEEGTGAGGGARHPWLKLDGEPVDFELPERTADSVLRVLARGPAAELRIRFDDQAPLQMELRERGPLEPPGVTPADGSVRVLLPAGVRRVRVEAPRGGLLEISLAYRTARSYRLSASAYRQLLAGTDAAALFRERLQLSTELRTGQLDVAPSAEQELLNHWAALLRRLPEATLRARVRPTGGGCVAPNPEVPGSLGRRLLAQQALFGCSPEQRQAGWERLSARADRAGDDLAIAVAALADDGSSDHWQWLAQAVQRHGWREWSLDVAQVTGLALPDLPPPTAPVLLARASAAGAIPAQGRGSERLGWLWRASSSQPLKLVVPAGSRHVELTVRALPGAQEQWLPVSLDGADFAAVALPGLAWSSDLLDARSRRPLPAAVRVAMDLPTGASELVLKPNAAEILVAATWHRDPAGSTQGPVVIIDPTHAGSGMDWAARYRFDRSGEAQALLAMLRAAANDDNDASAGETIEAAGNQAARSLAWARPGHWERLTVPEGGAGYRDLPAAPTPGERLLRVGQSLRGRVPTAGRYRVTSRWHGPAPATPAQLIGTWGELPVGQGSQALVLTEDAPWQLHLVSLPDASQASVRIEREQAGRWLPLAVDPASERWWIATRLEPITVYWPKPAVIRVSTIRADERDVQWHTVTPDQPLHLSPASGENERLLQIHIWQPGTSPAPPAQPGPSAEPWRRAMAAGDATPAAGVSGQPAFPAHQWTDAANVALTQRPEAEDATAAVAGSASWQLSWQRFRHLPDQQAFAGVEVLARTAAGSQAVGGSAFFDWQPRNSIWSVSIDADAWRAESQSVLGLRATGRADWTYGARWDHQVSVSGQVWHGPAAALDDSGVWSAYRASHRRAVTLEDRWRWWLSPASHGLVRLQWRSNEDLSRDQGSAWLGWQFASGRWSVSTEAGLRWLAADADRRDVARKPSLRFGLDFWHPMGSRYGLMANLGLLLGENHADQSIGLELTWFRHEGRGMDDFSPRRFRFLELRQGQFMVEQP